MKKDVLVAITSKQQFDGGRPEEISLVTCATLYEKLGKYYVAYDESELTGLEGTRTTVKLEGKTVSLIRTGTYPSHMQFIEQMRQVGLYETAMGAMTISIYASRIHNTIGEQGGELTIDYTVELDQNMIGNHHFKMVVTPN